MSFCEHCQGQRFDRARVLRILRQVRQELRGIKGAEKCDGAMLAALNAVRELDIPHLDSEPEEDMIIH